MLIFCLKQRIYDLMNLEVSLWRDGYPWPTDPGSEIHFFRNIYDGAPQVEGLEGWKPIYWPGAYWTRQSWGGFSALCTMWARSRDNLIRAPTVSIRSTPPEPICGPGGASG